MDRLDCMRLFVRVVERRSFSAAAADLGLSRSTATEAIKQLETTLGARLLERTTRSVTPTLDGEKYFRRCLMILADVEEAEAMLQDGAPKGILRIDTHPLLAKTFLLPRLPDFLALYPMIDLHIGDGDRFVDLIREGVDCVIRAGLLSESGMIARKIGELQEITCASPDYLARYGTPSSPDGLAGHQMIGFMSSLTHEIMPLEFCEGGSVRKVLLPSRVTVTSSDVMAELARRGLGLVQQPRYRFQDDLEKGILTEVLDGFPPPPTPLSLLYSQNRQVSPRIRAFIDWVVGVFAEAGL